MKSASEMLAEARLLAANSDTEGAIRLLKSELEIFTGQLEDRRRLVALLIAYCGRRERFDEAIRIASTHLELDPASVMDSPVKTRLVMNYAALKAASGNIPEAITLLGEILISAQPTKVPEDDITRVRTMLESLHAAEGTGSSDYTDTLASPSNSRSEAYLASAHISQLIQSGSYSEAARLSQASLTQHANLEDGPLKVTLMLNYGVALAGEGKTREAEDWLSRSYEIAARCLLRSGTLFALVARSYAMSLSDIGRRRRSRKVLEDLLEAQMVRFGSDHPEVVATKRLLSQVSTEEESTE